MTLSEEEIKMLMKIPMVYDLLAAKIIIEDSSSEPIWRARVFELYAYAKKLRIEMGAEL